MSTHPPIIFKDDFVEHHKVAWRVEAARLDSNNPLLEPEYPWDDGVVAGGWGTVAKDPIDGKYKAWTTSFSENTNYAPGESDFRLTYAESDDGVAWRRPMLDICPVRSHAKTNILLDLDSGGTTLYASVFIDPDENPDEPYEMFCFRNPGFQCPSWTVAGLNQEKPRSFLEIYSGPRATYGLYRYRSRDGLRWRPVEGPIRLETNDTCQFFRDPDIGYVAHHKASVPAAAGGYVPCDIGPGDMRVAMRRTSTDGTHWTESRLLMSPDWLDHQGDQIMELGRYPYRDGFIALATVFHCTDQTADLQFAASADGLSFWRPTPRRACLPNGPLGDYGGGLIWPSRTLVEHDGRFYIYYAACDGLHGDIYSRVPTGMTYHGTFCRASWEIGRMWAAVNAEGGMCSGYLTSKPQDLKGKRLFLNALTRPKGTIRVELLDENRKTIPGFAREDCRPFEGDDKRAPVTWNDHAACPRNGVHVRSHITKAMLYGCEWA